jgi:hypothetical protein
MRTVSRWHVLMAIGVLSVVAGPSRSVPAAQGAARDETPTVELTLSPAAEPVPALKYRLVPPLEDRKSGNAALAYYRAVVQYEPFAHSSLKFVGPELDALREIPLDKLPQEEVAAQLQRFDSIYKELERASLRDRCEWEVPLEADGIETLLTEFQELRRPAMIVALRARLQLARGDFAGACRTMSVNYQLSHNLGKSPLVIVSLIGCAVAQGTREQVETFVQQPGAPNLYWALSELPTPLVGFRSAVEGEARLPEYSFPGIVEFLKRPLSREEATRVSDGILKRFVGINDAGDNLETARNRFALTAVRDYTTDKAAVLSAGWSKEAVAKMPVDQVVWLASYYRWQVEMQDLMKWSFAESPQRKPGYQRSERKLIRVAGDWHDSPFEFINLLPALGSAMEAIARTDRGIALLRTVEALRLFAHDHQGELPDSLDKIRDVPLPSDPVTGRPFHYRLNGDTAVLETAPSFDSKWMGRRYVIHMRK